jgi:hypothetical protein
MGSCTAAGAACRCPCMAVTTTAKGCAPAPCCKLRPSNMLPTTRSSLHAHTPEPTQNVQASSAHKLTGTCTAGAACCHNGIEPSRSAAGGK